MTAPRRHAISAGALALVCAVACGRLGFDRGHDRTIAPIVDLDLGSGSLPGDLVFARASSATYVDRDGRIRIAAPDEPRFDHDPQTVAPLGLLIEGPTINLVEGSDRLDQPNPSGWFTNGAVQIVADAAIAPDGTMAADRFVDQDATGLSRRANSITVADDAQPYAFSAFVKAESMSVMSLQAELLGGTLQHQTYIVADVSTGQILLEQGAIEASGVDVYADGWYRLWLVVRNNATGNVTAILSVSNDRRDNTALGSVLVWGAQVEPGAHTTSYVPTGATVTARAADLVTWRDASWFTPDAGALRVTARARAHDSRAHVVFCATAVDGGTCLERASADGTPTLALSGPGGSMARLGGTPWATPSVRRLGWSYGGGEVAFLDETAPPSHAQGLALPTDVVSASLGSDASGAAPLDGHVSRFSFAPRHLSDPELAAFVTE